MSSDASIYFNGDKISSVVKVEFPKIEKTFGDIELTLKKTKVPSDYTKRFSSRDDLKSEINALENLVDDVKRKLAKALSNDEIDPTVASIMSPKSETEQIWGGAIEGYIPAPDPKQDKFRDHMNNYSMFRGLDIVDQSLATIGVAGAATVRGALRAWESISDGLYGLSYFIASPVLSAVDTGFKTESKAAYGRFVSRELRTDSSQIGYNFSIHVIGGKEYLDSESMIASDSQAAENVSNVAKTVIDLLITRGVGAAGASTNALVNGSSVGTISNGIIGYTRGFGAGTGKIVKGGGTLEEGGRYAAVKSLFEGLLNAAAGNILEKIGKSKFKTIKTCMFNTTKNNLNSGIFDPVIRFFTTDTDNNLDLQQTLSSSFTPEGYIKSLLSATNGKIASTSTDTVGGAVINTLGTNVLTIATSFLTDTAKEEFTTRGKPEDIEPADLNTDGETNKMPSLSDITSKRPEDIEPNDHIVEEKLKNNPKPTLGTTKPQINNQTSNNINKKENSSISKPMYHGISRDNSSITSYNRTTI